MGELEEGHPPAARQPSSLAVARPKEPEQPLHHIRYIDGADSGRAVARHLERLAGNRARDERGDGPAVAGFLPGTVRAVDPSDADGDAVVEAVRDGRGLHR